MLAYDDGVLLGSTLKKWHQDNAYFRLTPSKIAVSSMALCGCTYTIRWALFPLCASGSLDSTGPHGL